MIAYYEVREVRSALGMCWEVTFKNGIGLCVSHQFPTEAIALDYVAFIESMDGVFDQFKAQPKN